MNRYTGYASSAAANTTQMTSSRMVRLRCSFFRAASNEASLSRRLVPGVPLPLGADGLVLTATEGLLELRGGRARRVYLGRLRTPRRRQIDVQQGPQQLRS